MVPHQTGLRLFQQGCSLSSATLQPNWQAVAPRRQRRQHPGQECMPRNHPQCCPAAATCCIAATALLALSQGPLPWLALGSHARARQTAGVLASSHPFHSSPSLLRQLPHDADGKPLPKHRPLWTPLQCVHCSSLALGLSSHRGSPKSTCSSQAPPVVPAPSSTQQYTTSLPSC